MRVLVTIPHYFKPIGGKGGDGREHGSVARDPQPRIAALGAGIGHLHQLYHPAECMIDHGRKIALAVQQQTPHHLDVVVCTTRGCHVLDRLALPVGWYRHHATDAEPTLLGFECHAVLRDGLGAYDYYAYLEDDLVLHDPWLFRKLAWFTALAGANAILQPNRYEAGPHPLVQKAYIDGPVREAVTANFQDIREDPEVRAEYCGVPVVFRRPTNPHSGCFFLNAAQMARWAAQPYFLDRATWFIGPLESAATLGVMRTFKVYKPALENAAVLEIQHFGGEYLAMICAP